MRALFVILAILILAAVTKPSDQVCREKVLAAHGGQLAEAANEFFPVIGQGVYKIDDGIFFKSVTNRASGEVAGIGAFGFVFVM